MTDLGDFVATDLNDRGQVVGYLAPPGRPPGAGGRLPVCLREPGGALRQLGDLSGGHEFEFVLGERGQVATAAPPAERGRTFNRRAALREPGTGRLRDLGGLPGGQDSEPHAISRDGRFVVGSGDGPAGRFTSSSRAFLWEEGKGGGSAKLRDLGTFGGPLAEATGVNNRGQVVGWAMAGRSIVDIALRRNSWPTRAFLWEEGGGMRDLGALPGDGGSMANAVSERGDVVGVSGETAFRPSHAFVWSPGGRGMRPLPPLPGHDRSHASDVDGDGTAAVGRSYTGEGDGDSRAVLWRGGRAYDLTALLFVADQQGGGGGWRLADAREVNRRGQVLARGTRGGKWRHVLLTPEE